jgi:ankyrin repeat protein
MPINQERPKNFSFASSRASSYKPEVKIGAERSIELAISGDLDELQSHIDANKDIINVKDEDHGNVPLHIACSKGNIDMVHYLVRKGASLNIQDVYGNTPLHYALDKSNNEIAFYLMKHGCDVNISDYRGNTPLHTAALRNNYDGVATVLKYGGNPDALDFGNEKPAKKTRNLLIISLLEKASQKLKDGSDSGTAHMINWMGFGIGLGVGLGMALAKQQQFYQEEKVRIEKEELEAAKKKRMEDALASKGKKLMKGPGLLK